MGNLQATTSEILLGGSGEDISGTTHPTLESVSALQALDSQISDTSLLFVVDFHLLRILNLCPLTFYCAREIYVYTGS